MVADCSPCYGCEKKCVDLVNGRTCHEDCQEYLSWSEKHNERLREEYLKRKLGHRKYATKQERYKSSRPIGGSQ